jgi:hypothetical protein
LSNPAAAKCAADDEIRRLRARVDELKDELLEATRDGRRAREQTADFFAKGMFGRSVFAPNEPPPPLADADEHAPRRMPMRSVVQQLEREIFSEDLTRGQRTDSAAA